MYIELFLLYNFIMNMLIIRLAAAFLGMSYSKICAIIICFLQAIYSAIAIGNSTLCAIPFKIVLCILTALPFFIKTKRHIILHSVCILLSTFLIGGLVFAICSQGERTGIVRQILSIMLIEAMIRFILYIRKVKADNKFSAVIEISHNNHTVKADAILDSGSNLCDKVTGKPVVMIYAPELAEYAYIPISYSDTKSAIRSTLAFRADSVKINGEMLDVLIAPVCNNPSMKAIVPYFAICDFLGGNRY